MSGRALDLFCGAAGGWSLGLHRAGYMTVAACEADPWRRAIFSHNNPGAKLYDDVRTLTAKRLRADGLTVDIVVGSPPCQDASTANTKGRGVDGERTGLFFDAVRLIGEIRPLWACLENVPGLRTRGLDRILAALEALGYTCWPLSLGAVHAGAPHGRQRLWILAANADSLSKWEQHCGWWQKRRQQASRFESGFSDVAADADKPVSVWRRPDRRGPVRQNEAFGERFQFHWQSWNGGTPDLGRVDDGLSTALASGRGLGRACLAAYGDAVLPQITEAIGRAMARLLPVEGAA